MERTRKCKCDVWILTSEEFRDILDQMVFFREIDALEKAEELAKKYNCVKVYEDDEEIRYHDDEDTFITIRKSLIY